MVPGLLTGRQVTLFGVWLPIIFCESTLLLQPGLLFVGTFGLISCLIVVVAGGGGAEWPLTDRPIGFWIMRVTVSLPYFNCSESCKDPRAHFVCSKCLVTASTFYLVSSYLCRVSILCIYFELLRHLPRVKMAIKLAGAWVVVCGIVSMGVQLGVGIQDILFVEANLGPQAKQEGVKWVVYGVLPDVLSCVCDIIVFALPLRSLWSLQMRDRSRKIRLVLTFSVGFM